MAERDDLEYLEAIPQILHQSKEFKALDVVAHRVIGDAWDDAEQVENDQFLLTMDESSCERWETIMGINHEGNLEDRRSKIFGRYNSVLPYDVNALRRIITARTGFKGFEVNVYSNEFSVVVVVPKSLYNKVDLFLTVIADIIPANMNYYISVLYNDYDYLKGFTYGALKSHTYGELPIF